MRRARLTLRGGGINRLLAGCSGFKETEQGVIRGFTLAEILITLAVIGVVAAMTLPTLISTMHTKAIERKEQIFKHRLTNGIREMAVKSTLTGYNDAEEFAKELSNHYKIFGIYNSSNIASAYPVGEVIINKDGKTLKVSKIKNPENLNLNNENGENWSAPVAIVTPDGTPFIFSYNKNCTLSESDINEGMRKDSGSGEITGCIAGVYDRNGVKAPNKQGEDIISFNGGSLSKYCKGTESSDLCVANLGDDYQSINTCNGSKYIEYDSLGSSNIRCNGNYWAGAKKLCADQDMRLPTRKELQDIRNKREELNLPSSGDFWSSDSAGQPGDHAWRVVFENGSEMGTNKLNKISVVCIGD